MEELFQVEKLYKRDAKLKSEDVKLILEWCEKQEHLPKILELQAALALHACYYSVEAAKNCLEQFFTLRTAAVTVFGVDSNPKTNQSLKDNAELSHFVLLPGLTPEGYKVSLVKLRNSDPTLYNGVLTMKIFDMFALYHNHTKGPASGFCIVIDMNGGQLGHLMRTNVNDFRKFLIYLEKGFLVRVKHIHCVNVVPFLDRIIAIIKPFISKEFFEKIKIHMTQEELYNCVPKEMMPFEYGGQGGSLENLDKKYDKFIYEGQWFFDFLKSQSVDESKRSGTRHDYDDIFGFDGTFKQINID